MNKCLRIIALGLVCLTASPAQNSPAPATRLASAPPVSSWRIVCEYAQKEPIPTGEGLAAVALARRQQANPRLVEVQVVKRNSQREETHLYANGEKSIVWVDGDIMVARYRRFPSLSHATTRDAGSPRFQADFMDLEWLADAQYLGIKTEAGKSCHVYRESGEFPQEAWIGTDTNLPVRIVTANCVRTFTFSPSAPTLSFPPDVARRMAELRKTATAPSESE